MKEVLIKNIGSRFDAYNEIISECDDQILQIKLDIPKNKSLAEHFWCVVGARESYTRAIEANEWQGFACSLQQFTQTDISIKLQESASSLHSVINNVDQWTEARDTLLLDLNEHEIMHEGQLIRQLYGLKIDIPQSVRWA